VAENVAITWLYALDQAVERLALGAGVTGFVPDGARGGSGALDLYLLGGSAEPETLLDAVDVGRTFDSASAFCTAGAAYPDVDRAATLCAAEAIAFRIDAAATPFFRRSLATNLWHATALPASADVTAVDAFQANPERAVVARDGSSLAEGAALFLDYLDAARGRGPGTVGLASHVLASRKPSAPAPRFDDEPDVMDVFRATFGPTPSDVARLYGDFAVARAFAGDRDADGVFPTLAWLGRAGRVRFEWSVPFSSLPRLLSPARPVEPTGATYLWVAIDGNPAKQSFVFSVDWEPPVAFRWAIVLVAADGRVVRRVDVPFVERETHVERIVPDLDGAAGILVTGTNMGGINPTYPFDPDFEPYEPHSYAAHLARQ
jgi:hypothetical protein